VIRGGDFPQCNDRGGHVYFTLIKAAQRIDNNPHFRKSTIPAAIMEQEREQIPLKRRGSPDDVAQWIVRLADATSEWVTGGCRRWRPGPCMTVPVKSESGFGDRAWRDRLRRLLAARPALPLDCLAGASLVGSGVKNGGSSRGP
jgi:hypothetical protein